MTFLFCFRRLSRPRRPRTQLGTASLRLYINSPLLATPRLCFVSEFCAPTRINVGTYLNLISTCHTDPSRPLLIQTNRHKNHEPSGVCRGHTPSMLASVLWTIGFSELVVHDMSIPRWSASPQRMQEDTRFGRLRRHVHPTKGGLTAKPPSPAGA